MILLDTCALLWSVNKDSMTAVAVRTISQASASGTLFLSPISAWEIGILVSRGRLSLELPVESYIQRAFAAPGVRIAPVTPEIGVRSSFLPGTLHDDPVDRILVCTAMVMGLKLVTRDRRLLEYAAAGHLPVLAC